MNLSQVMKEDCLQNELERSFENVIKNSTIDDCSLIILVEGDYSFRGYRNLNEAQKRVLLWNSIIIGSKKRMMIFLTFWKLPKTYPKCQNIYIWKKNIAVSILSSF